MITLGGFMDYIDDLVSDMEERENRRNADNRQGEISDIVSDLHWYENGRGDNNLGRKRVLVGRVEHFFDRISVAAIQLTGSIKLGDTIEIENGNETVRLRVSSMQINKKDVEVASDGDAVGIKVDRPVGTGSKVYIIG